MDSRAMMRKTTILFLTIFISLAGWSQSKDSVFVIDDDPEVALIDSMLVATYLNHFCFSADTSILNINGYAPDSVPQISQEQIQADLALLDAETPMALSYNSDVQKFINLYTGKRRQMISRMLGMAELYFPMFDQVFDKYDIPYEMKYLAIVESGLNPQARSHAGAVGLWQFMHATGKMYGLRVNSYLDERMDPWKATDAACQYLQALYDRYGDWDLALAAYNCGPGNVNKAIRRSGGKKDYWSLRNYLPRETRSYVPAFIAVNYVMNHAADHNIFPTKPSHTFFECDTVQIRRTLKFDQIETFTSIPTEELIFLNPSYRRNVIPGDGAIHTLRLPIESAGVFLANEDSIYDYKKDIEQEFAMSQSEFIYRVRRGDVLGKIAQDHSVRLSDLRAWNNIRGNTIYPGQKLTMYLDGKKKSASQTKPAKKPIKTSTETNDGAYKYHTVQNGDTLWDIAKIYDGVSVDQLLQLNSGLNNKRLQPGQKIKIQKIS
jgi:membrane-bound lytic murein transglycosylase D